VLSPIIPVTGGFGTASGLNDPIPDGKSARSGRIDIPAGDHILEVTGAQTDGKGYSGPFLLETVVLDSAPEEAEEIVTVDSDVVEALFPVGDRDVFRLSAQAGDVLEAELTGLGGSPSPEGWVRLSLVTPGPSASEVIGVGVEFLPSGNTVPVQRFTLPVSGEYRLIVDSDSRYSANQGQYRFLLRRYPTVPETASAALSIGQVLTAEEVDEPGDVDDFEVQAAPGTTFGAAIEWVGGSVGAFLALHWLSELDRLSIKSTASGIAPGFLGRLEVPGTGRVLLRVAQGRFGGDPVGFGLVGPYRLWTYPISSSPESVTANFDWGVIKEGESIDPIGDLDEFAFVGTAGQRIRAYFEVPNGFPGGTGATMEIIGPGGDVLGSASVINATPDIRDTGTGVITLPANGAYLLRIRGTDDWNGPGRYRFLVEAE
jgi:hypothetical protein